MKTRLILILLVLLSVCVYGQKKLKKTIITESGFDIHKEFNPIKNKIEVNGLIVTVNPISAESLNSMYAAEYSLSGQFNYTHYEKKKDIYFYKRKRRVRRKDSLEYLKEGLEWLYEKDLIDKSEHDDLEKQILFSFDPKRANELYAVDDVRTLNPYWRDPQYLSVFDVTFENNTSDYKEFNEEMLIQVEDNVLVPKMNSLLVANDSRRGLYLPIVIPPNSKVKKYFSSLPIDHNSDMVSLHFPSLKSTMKWNIKSDKSSFSKSYGYYELIIDPVYMGFHPSELIFLLVRSALQESFSIIDEVLFVEESSIDEEFEIFAMSMYMDKITYGRIEGARASEFLDFNKGKRKMISFRLDKIEELKSKVKRK